MAGNERPVIRSDTELAQLVRDALRVAAEQRSRYEANCIAANTNRARCKVEEVTGVSADSFDVRYDLADDTIHFTCGKVELVARKPGLNSYDYYVHLDGGVCPVCGERLLSLPFANLADVGSALASLEQAFLTGGRPCGPFFDRAACKCTAPQTPAVDPQQEAINKLAQALVEVLEMGGYQIGGEQ